PGGGGAAGAASPAHRALRARPPAPAAIDAACVAAAEGRLQDPVCWGWFPSAFGGAVPDGKHSFAVLCQYAPGGVLDESAGSSVLEAFEGCAPGLSACVEDISLLDPAGLEKTCGVAGGHLWQGDLLLDWLFDSRPSRAWHRHRTPLAGLYMCGSGTHPGPAAPGLAGLAAA